MKAVQTAPRAARSMSASSSTTIGSLPPSSRARLVRFRLQSSTTRLPMPTLPVNMTVWTSRSTIMASASGTRQTTTLRTPGGRPASTKISPTTRAVSGVVVDGRRTTVLPAVRALRTSQMGMRKGKFQGEMMSDRAEGMEVERPRLVEEEGRMVAGPAGLEETALVVGRSS